MYCSQCGKEISQTSKFCANCGCPIPEEGKSNSAPNQQPVCDAVEDIQKKLKEIDNREKTTVKKVSAVKSALSIVKGEVSALDLVFGDNFESKKLEDKKQLILDYPFPTSPKVLLRFTKYIHAEIEAKRKEPDELTEVWKEKLKQAYLFAETEISTTKEFAEIVKLQKTDKRRERHKAVREIVVWLVFPIMGAFIASIVLGWSLLMFVSILAAGWELFLILYVYDLLDNMIDSIKQQGAKQKNVPKWLRLGAWLLLVPVIAALVTSLVYYPVALSIFFGVLLLVDAIFLCCVYDM